MCSIGQMRTHSHKRNVTATFDVSVWTVTRTVTKRLSKTRAATCDVTREDAFTVPQWRRIFFGRRQHQIWYGFEARAVTFPTMCKYTNLAASTAHTMPHYNLDRIKDPRYNGENP